MKKFFKILVLVLFVFLLLLAIDASKINYKYVNKPFFELNLSNLNSSFFKKITQIISYEIFPQKNVSRSSKKYYDPINFKDNSLVIKSDLNNINTTSNNSNIFNYSNWERSHGNNQSNRFSYLNEINLKNISKLKKIWEYSFDGNIIKDVQCNPIVKNGIIYVPTSNGLILSINAIDGSLKWKSEGYSNYVAKRGMLIDSQENKNILFFSDNKNLISLNAETGNHNLSFGNNGKVKLQGSSVVAPVIYKSLVITVTMKKTIEAFNKFNGKKLWIYSFEDPKNNEKAYEIDYLNYGGNPWGGISLDEKRGLLFITTGNPSSYFDGTKRPGDNRYSNSIIAFDINKKKIIWDFQETHHDIWNLDIPAPPILTSLKHPKKNYKIDVVIAVTKRGNTLVFDRVTGENFFDIKYRKAPLSKIQDEVISSVQIDKMLPMPFAKSIFSVDEITDRNKKNYDYVKKIISDKKFGFFETYEIGKKNIQFNFHGGAEWMGGSLDHHNGILYVTSNNIPWIASLEKNKNRYSSKYERLTDLDGFPGSKNPWGTITAINLNSGLILWQTPFGDYKEIDLYDMQGKKIKSGTENFGGVTGTAGNILFATGTIDKKFYAINSLDGEVLWEYELPFVGSNPPVVFETNGKQYILVTSTGSFSLAAGYPDKVKFGNRFLLFGLEK